MPSRADFNALTRYMAVTGAVWGFLLFLPQALLAQESTVNFTPPPAWSSSVSPYGNQTRLQVSAYAYPDFCAVVDGTSANDNTASLATALAATGLYFSTLEIPALAPCMECTQSQTNYYCTSLGTTWPNPTARVHIWKGATLSCALPPADATHIIQDDNLAPIIAWQTNSFPSTNGGAVYTCTPPRSCGVNDMSASGTYTGANPGNFCVSVTAAPGCPTADTIDWGFSAASNEQVASMSCSGLGPAPASSSIALGSGITASFVNTCGHNTNDTWSVAVTPAGTGSGYIKFVSTPATGDILCAHGSDNTISGVTCLNSSDATSQTVGIFKTVAPMPPNLWANGRALRVTGAFSLWTSATNTPGIANLTLRAGTTALASPAGVIAVPSSLTANGASASWLVTGAPSGSATAPNGYFLAQPLYNSFPGATPAVSANLTAQPVSVGTAGFNLGFTVQFTGPVTGTPLFYSCSGTCMLPPGSGTCNVTPTGPGSGAAGTIPVSGGSLAGQHIAISAGGSGYTTANSWTLSGTSCSGTIITTGGMVQGTAGNALQLQSLTVEQVN
jgi:hypothetical protein